MDLRLACYIIEILALIIALISTCITYYKRHKAVKYMLTYCNKHGGNKSQVVKEFRKVLKML